ncbi:MAG: GspH/FimT family pseudopilin [Halioglobus sp.]
MIFLEHVRSSRDQGFTLVELMIVVFIVAVLLGIGVPSFRSFLVDQRYRSTSADLRIALMTARSEAVKRNVAIQVTPTSDDDWTTGWQIVDPGDPSIIILNHVLPGAGNLTITADNTARFLPSGRVADAVRFNLSVGSGSATKSGCLRLEVGGYATDEGC